MYIHVKIEFNFCLTFATREKSKCMKTNFNILQQLVLLDVIRII